MKRTLSFVLILAMLFTAMLGIISGAEGVSAPALTISGANLEFGDTIYLYVAVDYSEFGTSEDVDLTTIKLEVTNTETGDAPVILERDESVESTKGFPEGSVGFKLDNLAAKNMGDELTLQALKGDAPSGESKTYSILEYALKAENLGNAKLTALVKAMVNYGAKAQEAFKEEDTTYTYDLSVDHSLVRLMGGATFAGDKTKAIMKAGDSLTATKAGAASTDVWYNSRVQQRGTGSSITVNYTKDNETLFVTAAPSKNIAGAQIDYEKMANAVVDGIWYEDRNGTDGWWYKFEDGRIAQVKWEKVNNVSAWWTTDASGNKIQFPGGFSGPNLKPIVNPGQQFIVHKNQYVEFTSDDPDMCTTAGSGSAFRFDSASVGAALAEIAGDANAKAFTVSFTFAAGDDSVNMFSYFSLRGGSQYKDANGTVLKDNRIKADNGTIGTKDVKETDLISNQYYVRPDGTPAIPYGRIAFIRGDHETIKNGIAPYLQENGTGYKSAGYVPVEKVIASSNCADSDIHTPGEFVTVHAVFVFETETDGVKEGMRIEYYVNDNPKCVATVDMSKALHKADFLAGGWYIDSANNAAVQSFLKSFAITSGNIADNFK